MLIPGARSATSAIALEVAIPTPARLASGASGESASKEALSRLNKAVAELKAVAIQPLLQGAVDALNAGDGEAASDLALQALNQDERSGFGWYLLGMAREIVGDFKGSIKSYEAALALLPDHADVANNLGRLAYRLGQKDVAGKLFVHFLARHPNDHEGANNLACVLRDQERFVESIDLLKGAIARHPEKAVLWNTLGTVLGEQGDSTNAGVFFDEALRLNPGFAKARYNRGNMRLAEGDPAGALVDCEEAIKIALSEDELQMMLLARSTMKIALGRIGEGWDDYEARLHPQYADVLQFMAEQPRWEPGAELSGKSLLVIAEQGLGDEVLFANVLPDIVDALGPEGRLTLAVERRLVPMFQRAFPTAVVGNHATFQAAGRSYRVLPFMDDEAMAAIDLWAPIGSLLRQYRRTVEAFPARDRYMTADPDRVAYWRGLLEAAPAGKKVGLLWKSGIINSSRRRFFSEFGQWAPVLATPGVTFVNLQYGDCAEEIEQARREFGVEIWTPPGIDLKQDLDEVSALCCALDLVIGFSNATFNLAGAYGAPAWLISPKAAWPRLGTERYPWYPQARAFAPPALGAWDAVMAEIAQALAESLEQRPAATG